MISGTNQSTAHGESNHKPEPHTRPPTAIQISNHQPSTISSSHQQQLASTVNVSVVPAVVAETEAEHPDAVTATFSKSILTESLS